MKNVLKPFMLMCFYCTIHSLFALNVPNLGEYDNIDDLGNRAFEYCNNELKSLTWTSMSPEQKEMYGLCFNIATIRSNRWKCEGARQLLRCGNTDMQSLTGTQTVPDSYPDDSQAKDTLIKSINELKLSQETIHAIYEWAQFYRPDHDATIDTGSWLQRQRSRQQSSNRLYARYGYDRIVGLLSIVSPERTQVPWEENREHLQSRYLDSLQDIRKVFVHWPFEREINDSRRHWEYICKDADEDSAKESQKASFLKSNQSERWWQYRNRTTDASLINKITSYERMLQNTLSKDTFPIPHPDDRTIFPTADKSSIRTQPLNPSTVQQRVNRARIIFSEYNLWIYWDKIWGIPSSSDVIISEEDKELINKIKDNMISCPYANAYHQTPISAWLKTAIILDIYKTFSNPLVREIVTDTGTCLIMRRYSRIKETQQQILIPGIEEKILSRWWNQVDKYIQTRQPISKTYPFSDRDIVAYIRSDIENLYKAYIFTPYRWVLAYIISKRNLSNEQIKAAENILLWDVNDELREKLNKKKTNIDVNRWIEKLHKLPDFPGTHDNTPLRTPQSLEAEVEKYLLNDFIEMKKSPERWWPF